MHFVCRKCPAGSKGTKIISCFHFIIIPKYVDDNRRRTKNQRIRADVKGGPGRGRLQQVVINELCAVAAV